MVGMYVYLVFEERERKNKNLSLRESINFAYTYWKFGPELHYKMRLQTSKLET